MERKRGHKCARPCLCPGTLRRSCLVQAPLCQQQLQPPQALYAVSTCRVAVPEHPSQARADERSVSDADATGKRATAVCSGTRWPAEPTAPTAPTHLMLEVWVQCVDET